MNETSRCSVPRPKARVPECAGVGSYYYTVIKFAANPTETRTSNSVCIDLVCLCLYPPYTSRPGNVCVCVSVLRNDPLLKIEFSNNAYLGVLK